MGDVAFMGGAPKALPSSSDTLPDDAFFAGRNEAEREISRQQHKMHSRRARKHVRWLVAGLIIAVAFIALINSDVLSDAQNKAAWFLFGMNACFNLFQIWKMEYHWKEANS